jgi:hypothetical protein
MNHRHRFRGHVAAVLIAFACASAITVQDAAAAEGGSTIASAPHLRWGAHQDGIGTHYLSPHPGDGATFWHVRVRRGDRISITLKVASTNGCGTNQFELFRPSVTDANLGSAAPITAQYVGRGNACFRANHKPRLTTHWRIGSVPFHGRATLWAGISSEAPTFSFVAHVHHRKHHGHHHNNHAAGRPKRGTI